MQTAVLLEQVNKTYREGTQAVAALQELSLSVADGEFLALIGPSGCGKSTLLRLVADLEQAERGRITVFGKSPAQARRDRDYGIVFQAPVLFDWRNVQANIEVPLEVAGVPARERQQRSQELLRLIGLADFAQAYPWQLSGGMQQRVALARALALQPPLLLMDEPFGALDELSREHLQEELLRLRAGNSTPPTVMFVTHSIAEAVFLADRIIVLSARPGRVSRNIPVGLAAPRQAELRSSLEFFEQVSAVRAALGVP
jgi:NitT/TauT family transport system ATP-binding protein